MDVEIGAGETRRGRDERLAQVPLLARLFRQPELGALVAAVAVFLVFAIIAPGFATLDGVARWTEVAADAGIVAIPVSLLMIGGEFDLSAGVLIGSSGVLCGLLVTHWGLNVWPSIAIVLLFGMTVGFLNGIAVVWTQLPSFIVTLGTFFILQGLNFGLTPQITGTVLVSGIDTGSGYDSARQIFGSSFWSPHDFPITLVWWIAITAIGTVVLTRTRVGNWIFAVGGDKNAARSVGVPIMRTKVGLFMAVSTMSALLGVMTVLRLREIQASEGIGREFYFIIAAVVGGCLLSGGYGSAIGAAIGAVIIGLGTIGIPYAGWNSDWTYLFLGVILVLAVFVNTWIRRQAEKVRR